MEEKTLKDMKEEEIRKMEKKTLKDMKEKEEKEEEMRKLELMLSNIEIKGLSNETLDGIKCMTLYTDIYIVATDSNQVFNAKMYSKYKEFHNDYLNDIVLPHLRLHHGEFLLKEFETSWAHYSKVIHNRLHLYFRYLGRYYVAREKLLNLNDVGNRCFIDLLYEEMRSRVMDAVICLINKERDGAKIDRELVKKVVNVFEELKLYEDIFEERIVAGTKDYYSKKASLWISENSCPEFMLKVEECLEKEENMVRDCMKPATEQKIVSEVEHKLLVLHSTQLFDKEYSGLKKLLEDGKVVDLARMYRLYSRVHDGLQHVCLAFKNHVTAQGMALVRQTEIEVNKHVVKNDVGALQNQQVHLIMEFIKLHEVYLSYVNDYFQSNSMFFKVLKEAFEVFCNKSIAGVSPAELLSIFCDQTLKKKSCDNDKSTEDTIDDVVKLLVYISDKDMFAEFHRKKLARRLLFNKSDSDEHERYLLTKLKQKCGRHFTSKMEGMVTDLTLCQDTTASFTDYLRDNPDMNPGFDLTVTVLTIGFWPSYKTCTFNLPPEMLRCVEAFKQFYQTRTKRTRITWLFSLGTCTIVGKFEPKTMDLIVTTLQASVLLLFNSANRLSYSDIKDQLDLPEEDVTRLLHSLSCAKYKILKKEPDTKTISKTDYFEFNSMFTDRLKRIKVPFPLVDDRKKVIETVVSDRRHAIEAAIVRIMKFRKVLGHHQLMSECAEVLSSTFRPDFKIIKLQIESLISRDYLERDSKDHSVYRYLA
ncbi:Cullins domain-containing protein [Dioscorea alata]|uniref:Cullins domain-containing protein n=1 Tax=Dioscorea alata TaxID=55571 RepID=A0ACB7W3Q5_DIOAL|nr:Cullins domain-containing protein [Dioscorea alata]